MTIFSSSREEIFAVDLIKKQKKEKHSFFLQDFCHFFLQMKHIANNIFFVYIYVYTDVIFFYFFLSHLDDCIYKKRRHKINKESFYLLLKKESTLYYISLFHIKSLHSVYFRKKKVWYMKQIHY